MSLETLRRYAASLPGAPRGIEWGADECYSIGGKMFAVFGIARSHALIAAKLTKKARDDALGVKAARQR
jgi:predicted DNA-binding protein (MmcQ/YjbR family)